MCEEGERTVAKGRGGGRTLMYNSNVLFLTCSHDIENDAHAPAVYSLSISPHSRCLEYLRCEVAGSTTKCLHQ